MVALDPAQTIIPLFPPLIVATAMVVLTVTIHFIGLAVLMHLLRLFGQRLHKRHDVVGQGLTIIFVVLSLFFIHGIEIWAYAGTYLGLNVFDSFEAALYFSTTTFSTLGLGDVTIDSHWRLVSAIEGINGFLLIGWSTAFFVSVIGQIRLLEADLERKD
jgi:hypothetical protein